MKKRIALLIIVPFLFKIGYVNAATSASIKVSHNSTIVGNSGTATLTITSDDVLGQIYGTFSCGKLGDKDLNYINLNGETAKSKSYTINWTAKSAGSYTCSVSGLQVGTLSRPEDGVYSVNATSKTINVTSTSSNKPSSGGNNSGNSSSGNTTSTKKEYSSDNTLKNLSIEGYDIEPKFDKEKTEYKLTVDQNIEKIKVIAEKNHDKASVSGDGEVNLSLGENTINIKVTAENGNEKEYKIIVSVEDLNPIKVNIGKSEYTLVKKNNDLIEKLEYYEETTIKIEEQDAVAYTNPKTKTTLVLLKDKDNNINYYIYDEKTKEYQEYKYIKVNNITLQLLDSNRQKEYYKKYKTKINDKEVNLYKLKKNSEIGLIYGINIATGNTGYYQYDEEEITLSRYYEDELKVTKNELENIKKYGIIGVAVTSLTVIIVIIIGMLRTKKRKNNKR